MKFKEYLIADLIDEIAMGPFGSNIKVSCFVDSGVPVLNGSNLDGFSLSESSFRYVTPEKADSLKKAIAHRGDIVITHRGTLGQIVYIPQSSKHDKYVISQSQFRVRCNDKVLPEYLVYYFHTPIGQHKLLSNASQVGVPALARPSSTFQQIQVCLPEVSEQRKVVSIVNAIQDRIANNVAINDNLLEQASTLFNSAIQQSTSVVYAELGSLAEVKGGKRLPKGVNLVTTPNQHPYIRVRDLNNTVFASLSNDYEYVDDETQQSISRYTVSTGDLLISIVGTIGLTAIVDHTLNKANLTENCVKLTNIKNVTPEYLLLFLRSLQGVEAISKGTVGAVQLKLPIKNIQSVTVPLLCDEELQPLQETLSAIFSQISANIVEMKQLADIRDTLLPKLMSGELDVSSLDL